MFCFLVCVCVWERGRKLEQKAGATVSLSLQATLEPSLEPRQLRDWVWVWVSQYHRTIHRSLQRTWSSTNSAFPLLFLFYLYPLLFISKVSLLRECSLERRRRNSKKRGNSWKILAGNLPAWTRLCRHLIVCGPWHTASTESASFLSTVPMNTT